MKTNSSVVGVTSVILCLIVLTLLNQPAIAQPPLFQSNSGDPEGDLSCTFLSGGEVICAVKAPNGILAAAHIQNGVLVSVEFVNAPTLIRGNPSCTNDNAGQVVCAVKGLESQLLVTKFNGSTWSEFQNLGGVIIGDPSCTYIGSGETGNAMVICAVKGTDSAVYVKRCTSRPVPPAVDCTDFEGLPGDYIGDPTIAPFELRSLEVPEAIVAIKGTRNDLVAARCGPVGCTGFQTVRPEPVGSRNNPRISGNPECTARPLESVRGVTCVGRTDDSSLVFTHFWLSDLPRDQIWQPFRRASSPTTGPRFISDPGCAPLIDGPSALHCSVITTESVLQDREYLHIAGQGWRDQDFDQPDADRIPFAQGNPSCTREEPRGVVCAVVTTSGNLEIFRTL